MTPVKVFLIECRTGCFCCSNENHYRGPFSSREVAEARVVKYRELRVLASQYSSRGNYHIEEYDGEQLPDGRIIFGSYVAPKFMDDEYPGGEEETFFAKKSR